MLSFFFCKLLANQLFLGFLILFGSKGSPLETNFDTRLVDDVESLLGLESDVALLHGDDALAEVDVGKLSLSHQLGIG